MTDRLSDAEAEELERLITGLRYDVRHGNAGVCGPGLLAAADGLERLLAYRRASQRAVEAAREHVLQRVARLLNIDAEELRAALAALDAALDGCAGREAK